ncbi:MAG TPA: phosphoglucomutase/phosphomannomutase family protein [Thermoanaerobaculia bacterium]|nr:phosphoglucomutase/phosphomannomutase family protein [Thermoanaerobaculia bacterium]
MTEPTIRFGTSGWRAVIADEFTFPNARRVVAAIARVLSGEKRSGGLVLVGYDTRFLADRFAAESAGVLSRHGFSAEVANRPVPTPVLAFEIRRRGAVGAINFTASHNPPKYLGIKFSTSDGAPALPEITKKIEAAIVEIPSESAPPAAKNPGFDPAGPYLADLDGKVDAKAVGKGGPHFSLDFRFGTSSGFLDGWLDKTGARLERMHAKADPLFGGQSPQCGEKELVDLAAEVRKNRSRLGLATDGDADRFGVVDDAGAYVQPNEILALLLQDMLGRKGKRGGVARSVATTHALDAIAARYGAPVFETPVGFKYIGELLLEKKIIFGGEESAGLTVEGHVPEKDGILADLLTAEMVGAEGKTIGALRSELWKQIGPFLTRRIDLPLSPEEKAKLAAIRKSPPASVSGRKVAKVNQLDGIKLIFEDGSWILIRESGTEPVARVYIEAKTEGDLDALARAGRELIA